MATQVTSALNLERHVVVAEPETAADSYHALEVDHVAHRWRGNLGQRARRRRQCTSGSGWRPNASGDAVPRPHRVVQVVTDPRPARRLESIGGHVRGVEPVVE